MSDPDPGARLVHSEAVMGTVVSFDIRAAPAAATGALVRAVAWLHWVDETFSPYRHDSEISRLDRGEVRLGDCDPEVRGVLARCEALREATGGYFDVRAAGRLDPSGLVKGWSVERASAILRAAGCGHHMIDGGGDVRVAGWPGGGVEGGPDCVQAGWRVAVVHPMRLDAFCAVLDVRAGAVATSGTYERGFHVVDPRRRRPATALAAVTVVGPELSTTDAYATAALAMGPSAPAWLEGLPDHDALVVDVDGRGWETAGFTARRLDRPGGDGPAPASSRGTVSGGCVAR